MLGQVIGDNAVQRVVCDWSLASSCMLRGEFFAPWLYSLLQAAAGVGGAPSDSRTTGITSIGAGARKVSSSAAPRTPRTPASRATTITPGTAGVGVGSGATAAPVATPSAGGLARRNGEGDVSVAGVEVQQVLPLALRLATEVGRYEVALATGAPDDSSSSGGGVTPGQVTTEEQRTAALATAAVVRRCGRQDGSGGRGRVCCSTYNMDGMLC
jgi:hypothetical protein